MDVALLAARTNAEHNLAYASALGGRTLVTPDAVAVDIASPAQFLNSVLGVTASADLASIARDFFPGPHSVVDYLGGPDLTESGYEPTPTMPIMVRDPGPLPTESTAGLAIERVRDVVGLAAFERIVIDGMGIAAYAGAPPHSLWGVPILDRPSMRLHLGSLDGRPVACAVGVALDDCVGVFAVATLPDVRRRGYGAALTCAVVADAPDLPAVLTSSPLGFGVYSALGFVTVGERRGWKSRPSS